MVTAQVVIDTSCAASRNCHNRRVRLPARTNGIKVRVIGRNRAALSDTASIVAAAAASPACIYSSTNCPGSAQMASVAVSVSHIE